MIARRAISALMLLALLLSAQALAVARGQGPGVMQVVLCTGFGTHVVTLDADGNRVGDPQLCPDGLAAMVAQDLPAPGAAPLPELATEHPSGIEARRLAGRLHIGFRPRGPPLA